jgi:PAS domain S-box-containing protein
MLSSVSAAEPKRVLVIHSFGSVAPPFTTHSTAFETELVKKMGNRVDLDEASLDMARYASPDMQDALVDYLEKRGRQWKPDLVVPIGSPAAVFVAKYRSRLFSQIPILYCGLDERLLGPDAFDQNTTLIGSRYEVSGFAEDILQIAPDTKNIAVVIGATPLERYWTEVFRREFEPFTNRVNFIWLNDLPFEQTVERARDLPPKTFIFLVLFLRDAAGVTQNADDVLQRLHAVANAPINSIFTSQMGLGIVGGRLYPSTEDGIRAAEIAVRLVNGESPSNFPHQVIPPSNPQYDWRELERWNIDQKKLPAGSRILFRSPTMWERRRGWIIFGAGVFVLETLLIVALLANLFRRRRAERSLVESEERFRIAADAAPVLMWMAGPDKRCTFFNKAWLEFTGRTMEEEVGDGWLQGVHPEDLDECLATYSRAFDAREPFTMQYCLRRHDGEYRCLNDDGVPRFDPEGQFIGYVGACVDVDDLLQKERELNESEERIALAAEAAHLGVWEWETRTNKLWLSDAARKLFQFAPEAEITYSMLRDRVHPDDRAMREEAVRRAAETQAEYEIEYRIVLPDQTVRWIVGRGRYVSDPKTKQGRLLSVSIDITDRKQTEQLFQLAADGSHLGVWDWDETTGTLFSDRAMRQMFGVASEGQVGLDEFYAAIYPPDLEHVQQVWRHAVEFGEPYELEHRVQRSNGAIGWIHARGRGYYDDKGKPLRMIGVVFDISDRKQAEEQALKRRQELDRLSRVSLLGEMTASIAHELNQPLAGIVTNANAGERFIDRGNVNLTEIREILGDIAADGRRASDIIKNIRNTIKKGAEMRKPIDLNAVATHVSHMLRSELLTRSCELELSLGKDLPVVEGDPIQIQQVLINLVNNACDAMRGIAVKFRKVTLATDRNGDGTVQVFVRDTGPGIPEEVRERLFDQFFTTKEDGLGMGLAIVRSIIEAHHGTIAAKNLEDGGAEFCFTLPTREI